MSLNAMQNVRKSMSEKTMPDRDGQRREQERAGVYKITHAQAIQNRQKKKKEIKQIHSEFDLEKRNMKIMIIVVFDETIRGEKLRNQKSNTIYESQNHHHHHQPPTTTTYELNGVRETIGF